MATNRTTHISAIWADGAPNVDVPPVPGVTYAESDISDVDIETGLPYKIIVPSQRLNEILKRITDLLTSSEQYGILPWCPTTGYKSGGLATGSDNIVYRAVIDNSNVDPTTSSATYWTKYPGGSDMSGLGYQAIIGGFIVKWGFINNDTTSSTINLVFPTPFPNACWVVLTTAWTHLAAGGVYTIDSRTVNGVTIAKGGAAQNYYFDWIAIGC